MRTRNPNSKFNSQEYKDHELTIMVVKTNGLDADHPLYDSVILQVFKGNRSDTERRAASYIEDNCLNYQGYEVIDVMGQNKKPVTVAYNVTL